MKQDLNVVVTDLVSLQERKIEHILDLDDEILLDLIKCYLRPMVKERKPVKVDYFSN